jgi:hypothetical protein
MNKETTQTSTQDQFGGDSAKRQRALEKMRILNEATLNALRKAGAERQRKEAEELALREGRKPAQPAEPTVKKPTMPAA